jgi:NitT/TauT family transport system substrate-binding protein
MTRLISRRNAVAGLGLAALAAPHIARAATKTVRLGYGVAVLDPSTAPWLSAAKTAGFWQAEGLDVQVTGFNGAGPALQLLANNQLDMVFTGTPEAMKLRDVGVPVRTVANAYDHNHNYPAVPIDSPIRTIEDFRGKRMGIQTMTGSIYLWEKVLLKEHNMALTDLASVIPVGTGAPAVRALQSHQIDILGEWHGHYAFLETVLGLKLRKFDQDPALSKYSFVQAFFSRDDIIAKDPQMVTGVLRGVAQGLRFAIENPKAAVRGHYAQFPTSRPTGIDEDKAVEQSAKVVSINVELSQKTTMARRWGMASPQQIESVRDVLAENGIIQKKLPWRDYFNPQFIDALNDYDVDAVIRKAKAAG